MRWVFRIAVLIIALSAICGGAAYFIARSSLPVTNGEIILASGPSLPVRIVRDRNAVPHISAQSRNDVAFGQGFAHAQDRLWQMEVNRRIASGRLAEIFGPPALDTDRFIRTLGVRRAAEQALGHLKPETRSYLDAYAAGVNAFLQQNRSLLPPEFLILGVEPEPWSPVDSIGWMKMMAWDLSGNWGNELARLGLARHLNKTQIDEFFPPYPGDAPVALADYGPLYRQVAAGLEFDRLAAILPTPAPDGIGSNNWVLHGSRTVTGAPLLANDPHLGLTTPAIWYFAHLASPAGDVIGASLPGVPGIVLGHNGNVAWGFTNTGPDTQDLYIEKIDPADPPRYMTPQGSAAFAVREEVIRIKGQPDLSLTVRETRHGPVISDVHAPASQSLENGHVLSFAWTALRPDDRSADSLIGLDTVRDWPAFVENFRNYVTPQQNIVYADKAGNIGFLAPALIPRRRADNDLKGLSPAPGWDARYDWDGFVPFDELPRSFNPSSGKVVTANHKIVPDSYPHYLTSEWTEPYRAQRIEQLLAERAIHSVESFKQIQGDVTSLMAEEILPFLLDAPLKNSPRNEDLSLAREQLASWDGSMAVNRPEPLIFQAWYRELTRLILADELGEDFERLWRHRPVFMRNVLANTRGQGRWCHNVKTRTESGCADLIAEALDLAIDDLRSRYGRDMLRWRWGEAHFSKSTHRPFSNVAPLRRLFEVNVPTPGDAFTVNVGRNSLSDSRAPYANGHAASLRAIYDLADLNRSLFVHSTGQSGHPLSPHYRNLAPVWGAVGYLPMSIRPGDTEAGAIGTLILRGPN